VTPPTHAGGCQCGAVRYEIKGPLQGSHVCHCRMCQRATGGVFAALVGQAPENVRWTRGTPAVFESSNIAKRGFCAACGTPLSFSYNAPQSRLYLTIGSLDHPEAAPILKQYGVESRLPWVQFCDSVPCEVTGEAEAATGFFDELQNKQSQ
jgi:hypothetical protein